MTVDATETVLESGEAPSVSLGVRVLLGLAEAAVPDGTERQVQAAARGCWQSLIRPCGPYRGWRRRRERHREQDRVPMMLAEAWIAWEHYDMRRTRKEAADLLGLTPRQLRTREALLQLAIDHLGLDWTVKPAFRGRPPGRGWKPAAGGRPGTLRQVAASLGVSERSLFRFLHEMHEVDIDVVDRVLCNARTPTMLRDLYPDLYDDV